MFCNKYFNGFPKNPYAALAIIKLIDNSGGMTFLFSAKTNIPFFHVYISSFLMSMRTEVSSAGVGVARVCGLNMNWNGTCTLAVKLTGIATEAAICRNVGGESMTTTKKLQ